MLGATPSNRIDGIRLYYNRVRFESRVVDGNLDCSVNCENLRWVYLHWWNGTWENTFEITQIITQDTPIAERPSEGFKEASTFHLSWWVTGADQCEIGAGGLQTTGLGEKRRQAGLRLTSSGEWGNGSSQVLIHQTRRSKMRSWISEREDFWLLKIRLFRSFHIDQAITMKLAC